MVCFPSSSSRFLWEEDFGVIFAVDISLCALMRCDLPFLFLVVHKGPSFATRCLLHESNKNVKWFFIEVFLQFGLSSNLSVTAEVGLRKDMVSKYWIRLYVCFPDQWQNVSTTRFDCSRTALPAKETENGQQISSEAKPNKIRMTKSMIYAKNKSVKFVFSPDTLQKRIRPCPKYKWMSSFVLSKAVANAKRTQCMERKICCMTWDQ